MCGYDCTACGKYHGGDYFCEPALVAAHKEFVAKQVDLPKEFAEIINRHFWDLF